MQAWISFFVTPDILVTLYVSSEEAIETAKLLALKESLLVWYLLKKSRNSSQEIFTLQFLLEIIVRVLLLQVFVIFHSYADCESMFFAGVDFFCWCSSCCNKAIKEAREWWKTHYCRLISIEPLLHEIGVKPNWAFEATFLRCSVGLSVSEKCLFIALNYIVLSQLWLYILLTHIDIHKRFKAE